MKNLTQRAILSTFRGMLETTPFDKITVSAIIKECGISHNTFYYHYQDIYQLLDELINNELGIFVREAKPGGWEQNVKELLYGCRSNRKIVYHIYNSLSRDHLTQYIFATSNDVFYEYVCQQAQGRGVSEERKRDVASFCRYAFFGYFLRFLGNKMEDDIDENVDRLSGLFLGFVEYALSAEEQNLSNS